MANKITISSHIYESAGVCVSVDLGEAWLCKSTSTCGSAELELKLEVGGDQVCSTCFHSEAPTKHIGTFNKWQISRAWLSRGQF